MRFGCGSCYRRGPDLGPSCQATSHENATSLQVFSSSVRLDYLAAEGFVGFDGSLRNRRSCAGLRGLFFARHRSFQTAAVNHDAKLFLDGLDTGNSRQAGLASSQGLHILDDLGRQLVLQRFREVTQVCLPEVPQAGCSRASESDATVYPEVDG
jgi:hypothetical protein